MKSLRRSKTTSSKPSPARRQGGRLTKQELMLQPWFLPKGISRIILGLVPPDYRKRLHDYFDDYGCMRCNRLDVPYKSNGMCLGCMSTVYGRLEQSIIRRSAGRLPRRYGRELVRKAGQARKLLGEFSNKGNASPKVGRYRSVRLSSPVIETF
jgi:hypothetical protein